jgi:cysteine desulfurase
LEKKSESMRKDWIYMDYNSTTPCDEEVVEAMLPWFHQRPGNAASRSHPYGWEADTAVQQAREQIAHLIGAEEREIVFTSGATESNNLALKGIFEAYARKGRHLITVASEHNAVLDACEKIEKMGGEVTYLPVQENGQISLGDLEASIRPDTILVAVMWANNETGRAPTYGGDRSNLRTTWRAVFFGCYPGSRKDSREPPFDRVSLDGFFGP